MTVKIRSCPICRGFAGNSAPIKFGASVGAMVSYLSVYQYLSYHRMALLAKDLFGLSISEVSIDIRLERNTQKAMPVYHAI